MTEGLNKWIEEATASIKAPEKRHEVEKRIYENIHRYEQECESMDSKDREAYVLRHLGSVIDFQETLSKEEEVRNQKSRKAQKIAGIVSLLLAAVFSIQPIRIFFLSDYANGWNFTEGYAAGQFIGGQIFGAVLWLVIGTVLLVSSIKNKR